MNGATPSDQMLERISDLFLKYGLRSTSMDDICNHLKISKKTLYTYFENKEQLVEAVMMHRHKSFNFQTLRNNIQPHSAIKVLLGTIEYFITTQQSLIPSNIFDMKKYHPAIYEKMVGQVELFVHEFFSIVVDKGMADGLFRTDIDKGLQIWLWKRQISYLQDPDTQDTLEYPIENIIRTAVENFIRSIATDKGLKQLEALKKEAKNLCTES